MAAIAKALISWVPSAKGGRQQPPSGPIYSTLVRFDEDTTWPNLAWSLVVEFIRSYAEGKYTYAKIRFLSEDAPHHLLHAGSRFQLYEGWRMVATGLVREGDEIPSESAEFETSLLH
jgi:hypothetical protein